MALPAILGSTVIQDAAVHLNDAARTIWSDSKLLPSLQTAWLTFREELKQSSIPDSREENKTLAVTAGATGFDTDPANIIYPIWLGERIPGTTDEFTPMKQVGWDPTMRQANFLRFWKWQKERVRFLGATVDVEVYIRYMAYLGDINATGDPIPIHEARSYLGWRTASHAAAAVGEDYERAAYLESEAEKALQKYLASHARGRQNMPMRRHGYGYRRRSRMYT